MNATPNTIVQILGGSTTPDEWGDHAESETVMVADVPASIKESRQVIATESDSQAVAVHYYTGRLPAGTPVTKDQRIRDADGTVYSIDYVNSPKPEAVPSDIRLDLRRVT